MESTASRSRAASDAATELRHGSASHVHWSTSRRSGKASPSVKSRAAIEPLTPTNKPVEPGAGADEDPAGEPLRAIVTNRRARVRIIRVISVGADRRRYHCWPNSHTDAE